MEILLREVHSDDVRHVKVLCKQLGYEISLSAVKKC
jgi:hypothetical protein